MNKNLKVISQRVKYLRETANELRESFKKNGNKLIEDLYLEIECYCDMIDCHTKLLDKKLERGRMKTKQEVKKWKIIK